MAEVRGRSPEPSVRSLKLVIWDLDETILTGVLEEGEDEVDPRAENAIRELDRRGILQALATQNPPRVVSELRRDFGWFASFVRAEADLGTRARKVQRILEELDIHPLDAAFVDEDPFERDSIAVQVPHLTTWCVAELARHLEGQSRAATPEAVRRPEMYREERARVRDRERARDYTDFLRSCNIQVIVRPYQAGDAERAKELLRRTHRMNLGTSTAADAAARLDRTGADLAVVAEVRDVYGDLGRSGFLQLVDGEPGEARIESLAISCRTRARGLSQALLIGLLCHVSNGFERFACRYEQNAHNRPLRILLMAAGFKPRSSPGELVLETARLRQLQTPDWVHVTHLDSDSAVIRP